MLFKAHVKQDQKIIFLSPLTTVHIFSVLRPHGVHQKGRDLRTPLLLILNFNCHAFIECYLKNVLLVFIQVATYLCTSTEQFKLENNSLYAAQSINLTYTWDLYCNCC